MTQPIPGWYSDPTNPLQERLWDGATWTDQVRPQSPTSMPPPPPGLAAYDSGNSLLRPTFVEAVKDALQRFFEFKGRSSRGAYWFFILFSLLAQIGEGLLIGSGLLGLVLLIPGLAAGVRRMHDVDRSGWFVWLPFVNLYFLCQPGDSGPNRYGAPPR